VHFKPFLRQRQNLLKCFEVQGVRDLDKKQKIAHLQHLIRAQRAQLDPEVLAAAQRTAEKIQAGGKGFPPSKAQSVPYNRTAATKAVETFLDNPPDQKSFRARLLAFLTKSSH
jgi:hypothetical protein